MNSGEVQQKATESCQYPFDFHKYERGSQCQRAGVVCTANQGVWELK